MNWFLNLLVCNVNKREIKREKVQMKPPIVVVYFMADLTHYRLFITVLIMRKMIGFLLRTCIEIHTTRNTVYKCSIQKLHGFCLCTAFWVPSNIYSAHQEVVVLYFMANLTHYRLFITGFMMWKMIGLLLLRTCPAPAACSIYKTRTYQQTFAISRPSGNCNIGKSASILL